MRDREFELEQGSLSGFFLDAACAAHLGEPKQPQLRWRLKLSMREKEYDGEDWAPYFQMNEIAVAVRTWKQLEGTRLSCRDGEGCNMGTLSVFDDEPVKSGELCILRREGTAFFVQCDALLVVEELNAGIEPFLDLEEYEYTGEQVYETRSVSGETHLWMYSSQGIKNKLA